VVTSSTGAAGELKIVFTGPMGAGKTTAIRSISPETGLSTEVPLSEGATALKSFTTVGFDYGECRIDDRLTLRLFGTPGQERFRFMWDILAAGAFGLIVLADNSRPDPIADVEHYLQAFAWHLPPRRMVVGVGRLQSHPSPGVDAYCVALARKGWNVPVIEVDVRSEQDVRLMLSVLVSMAEVEHG
jgi:signal recognition particle receptor subunit beta